MAKKKTTQKTTCKKTDLQKQELTSEEQHRVDQYYERTKIKPLKFKTVKSKSGNHTIDFQNPDDCLKFVQFTEAIGTADRDLQVYLLQQVMTAFKGIEDENKEKIASIANNALAMLNGIQPQDEIEGMLAVQMVGVHNMAMETLGRAILNSQTFAGKETNVNQATKMLRTFIAQMEALKNYRTGGQQKMTVEHVHVNEGGQAIVGMVNQGGGGKNNENCG